MDKNSQSPDLLRMTALASKWEQENDRRAIFAQCYSMMTRNILEALEEGRFQDAGWVDRLLSHFAGYYFKSLETYDNPDLQTSAVWQYAHTVALDGDAMAIQNLILGVNAHINYDLVLATADILDPEWSRLDEASRQNRYEDYCLVNDIIGETIDNVQDLVLERYDPRLDILDKLLGPIDELLTSHLIKYWRSEVWENALRMIELTSMDEREKLRLQIETASIQRADFIMHGPELALKRTLFDL
jgi:hypothetical protein